jgi:hypothetical protein
MPGHCLTLKGLDVWAVALPGSVALGRKLGSG